MKRQLQTFAWTCCIKERGTARPNCRFFATGGAGQVWAEAARAAVFRREELQKLSTYRTKKVFFACERLFAVQTASRKEEVSHPLRE